MLYDGILKGEAPPYFLSWLGWCECPIYLTMCCVWMFNFLFNRQYAMFIVVQLSFILNSIWTFVLLVLVQFTKYSDHACYETRITPFFALSCQSNILSKPGNARTKIRFACDRGQAQAQVCSLVLNNRLFAVIVQQPQ